MSKRLRNLCYLFLEIGISSWGLNPSYYRKWVQPNLERCKVKRSLIFVLCLCSFIAVSHAEETIFVVSYSGDVKIMLPGSEVPAEKVPGMILGEGARVVTGEESSIEISFGRTKNSLVKIKEKSNVLMYPFDGSKVYLENGEVTVLLKDMRKDDTFSVSTPSAVCGARGTGWDVKSDADATEVSVFEGKVFVRGVNEDGTVKEAEYWVDEGYRRKIVKLEHPGEMVALTISEREEIEWN